MLVTNQFGADQEWVVKDPVYLLLPTWKLYVNGLPIYDNDNHLACYDISPHDPLPFTIHVVANDQFGDSMFMVLENEFLCVPSTKKIKPSGSCAP